MYLSRLLSEQIKMTIEQIIKPQAHVSKWKNLGTQKKLIILHIAWKIT
jgi:hypothetical protein